VQEQALCSVTLSVCSLVQQEEEQIFPGLDFENVLSISIYIIGKILKKFRKK
jgi:hypothetical protein